MRTSMLKAFILFYALTLLAISGCSSSMKWTKANYGSLKNKNFHVGKIELLIPSGNDSINTYYFWRIYDGLPLKEIKQKIETEKGIYVTIDEAAEFLKNKSDTLQTSNIFLFGRSYFWQSSTNADSENVIEIIYKIRQIMDGGNSGIGVVVRNKSNNEWRNLNSYSANFILGYALIIDGGGAEGILDSMNSFVKKVIGSLKEH